LGARTASSTPIYWRLVRSVGRGRKVVQETVAQLGELDAEGRANARLLAQQITGTDQQLELFEAPAISEQTIAVGLDRVCIERARWFGGVWLGWKLWRALQLEELCAELMPPGSRSDFLGPDGGGIGNRALDRTCERAAHRRGLVSQDRAGGSAGTASGAG
jgi:hypothetical protein